MFYNRFIWLCEGKGVRPSVVAKEIGLSNAAPTYWKNGSVPKAGTIQALADYFGVSVDFLLEQDEGPVFQTIDEFCQTHPKHIDDIDLKFALWGGAKEITDEDLEDVRRYAEFILERKKKKPPQD